MIIPDRGVTLGALVANALERGGIAVDTVIETNAIELLKAAVAAGHAVTFLNELDVRPERRAGSLVFLKLPDGQMARQELRLIQSARGGLDAAPSLLAEHLREAVAGLND
jgi:DNA-binding transcriptional LysR family regulator